MAVLSRTSDKFSVGIFYCIVRRPARELWPVGEELAGLLANVASIVLNVDDSFVLCLADDVHEGVSPCFAYVTVGRYIQRRYHGADLGSLHPLGQQGHVCRTEIFLAQIYVGFARSECIGCLLYTSPSPRD